jgi:transcriptional regulator with XRE-family HTH domain
MPENGADNDDRSRTPEGVFGKALKFYRERAGLSQTELAALSNYSNSVINKIERGYRPPAENFPERMDDIPELDTNGELARLWGWLKDSARHGAYPGWFDRWPDFEAKTTAIRSYEPLLMPGLLQTEDYARAVLRGAQVDATEDEIEQQVTARLERQEILSKESPPYLRFVIDEGVLHRLIGNPKTMHDQLMHLADMADRPKVSVQVIPFSAAERTGLLGAFAIADIGGQSVLYLETAAEGQIVEVPSQVHGAELTFDTLRTEALPRAASRDLILKVAEEK